MSYKSLYSYANYVMKPRDYSEIQNNPWRRWQSPSITGPRYRLSQAASALRTVTDKQKYACIIARLAYFWIRVKRLKYAHGHFWLQNMSSCVWIQKYTELQACCFVYGFFLIIKSYLIRFKQNNNNNVPPSIYLTRISIKWALPWEMYTVG